jgi:hypothetical protein
MRNSKGLPRVSGAPTKKPAVTAGAGVDKLLYDRESAAEALSISPRAVDYSLARREFETRRVGRRVLITAASLKSWASKNHLGPVNRKDNTEETEEQPKRAA